VGDLSLTKVVFRSAKSRFLRDFAEQNTTINYTFAGFAFGFAFVFGSEAMNTASSGQTW
jgi:hypothetical protein